MSERIMKALANCEQGRSEGRGHVVPLRHLQAEHYGPQP